MKEMTFSTIGILPVAGGRWHIRTGGGHLWLVNEDADIPPYAIVNGVFRMAVDAAVEPDAPLIMPKVDA